MIGLAGQNAAVDENLTGLENLEMVGRLYHVPAAEARRRGEELLERFELSDAAQPRRPRRTPAACAGGWTWARASSGARRSCSWTSPRPASTRASRLEMWDVIRELVNEGTTLLLTTQYLEEADRLADRIAVIDGGKVIAEGTSDELKARVGGEVLALRVADRERARRRRRARVLGLGPGGGNVDNNDAARSTIPVGTEGTAILTEAVRRLDDAGHPARRHRAAPADARRRLPVADRPRGRGGRTATASEDGDSSKKTRARPGEGQDMSAITETLRHARPAQRARSRTGG